MNKAFENFNTPRQYRTVTGNYTPYLLHCYCHWPQLMTCPGQECASAVAVLIALGSSTVEGEVGPSIALGSSTVEGEVGSTEPPNILPSSMINDQ